MKCLLWTSIIWVEIAAREVKNYLRWLSAFLTGEYNSRPPLWSSVRVLGYRSGGPGSIPGTTRKKSSGSGTGSTQPREYN
jgi:hypothetical protein